jgi:hypothetical protein
MTPVARRHRRGEQLCGEASEELEAKGESLENVEKYREKIFVEICGEGREGD